MKTNVKAFDDNQASDKDREQARCAARVPSPPHMGPRSFDRGNRLTGKIAEDAQNPRMGRPSSILGQIAGGASLREVFLADITRIDELQHNRVGRN